MQTNETDFFSIAENMLTCIGMISLIIAIIKIIIFLTDHSSYVNVKIRYFEDQNEFIKNKNDYPIIDEVEYDENGSIFLIGAVDQSITNIKIYDLRIRNKFSNTRIQFLELLYSRFMLKKKLEKTMPLNLIPGEYLLIKCIVPEGIPPRLIRFRVNGKIVEYDFHYNGIYGNRDMDYIREKHDLFTLLYHWFRI